MLLDNYVSEEYLELIFDTLDKLQNPPFYVYMGGAWLLAECLVKYYDQSAAYILTSKCDAKTINKGIAKARESFRISDDRKNYLKTLKK